MHTKQTSANENGRQGIYVKVTCRILHLLVFCLLSLLFICFAKSLYICTTMHFYRYTKVCAAYIVQTEYRHWCCAHPFSKPDDDVGGDRVDDDNSFFCSPSQLTYCCRERTLISNVCIMVTVYCACGPWWRRWWSWWCDLSTSVFLHGHYNLAVHNETGNFKITFHIFLCYKQKKARTTANERKIIFLD